jgi:hypothetical protein
VVYEPTPFPSLPSDILTVHAGLHHHSTFFSDPSHPPQPRFRSFSPTTTTVITVLITAVAAELSPVTVSSFFSGTLRFDYLRLMEASRSSPPSSPIVSYLTTTASKFIHHRRRLFQQHHPPSSSTFPPHFTTSIELLISSAFSATRSEREKSGNVKEKNDRKKRAL